LTTDQLRNAFAQLTRGEYSGNVFALIHDAGEEGFIEARPIIETYLRHSEAALREISLSVLTLHWQLHEHRTTVEQMAVTDASDDVRRLALYALGSLLAGSRDRKALGFLLRFVVPEERWDIREAAYTSLLRILGADVATLPLADAIPWPAGFDTAKLAEAKSIAETHGAPQPDRPANE
jgi:hypothetical protein